MKYATILYQYVIQNIVCIKNAHFFMLIVNSIIEQNRIYDILIDEIKPSCATHNQEATLWVRNERIGQTFVRKFWVEYLFQTKRAPFNFSWFCDRWRSVVVRQRASCCDWLPTDAFFPLGFFIEAKPLRISCNKIVLE